MALRCAGRGYVLGVNSTHYFGSWHGKPVVAGTADEIIKALDAAAWRRLSAGLGTKGERLHDWACLELADLEADEFCPGAKGLRTCGLLIRRHVSDEEMACFTTWCPTGTAVETLVAVEGHRWVIEDSFETAKSELSLTHNETRSWHGWHTSRVAGHAGFRDDGGDPPSRKPVDAPKNTDDATDTPDLVRWSIQKIRRIAVAWHSGVFDLPAASPGRSSEEHTKPPRSKPTSNEKSNCNAGPGRERHAAGQSQPPASTDAGRSLRSRGRGRPEPPPLRDP